MCIKLWRGRARNGETARWQYRNTQQHTRWYSSHLARQLALGGTGGDQQLAEGGLDLGLEGTELGARNVVLLLTDE